MTPAEFHNALRIMRNIDISALYQAGIIDDNWGRPHASDRDQVVAFLDDPYTEALRMPDDNFDRLFALIESRQVRRTLGLAA